MLRKSMTIVAGLCALMFGAPARAEADASTFLAGIYGGDATMLMVLNGYANGISWANSVLAHRGQPRLFCPPDDVAISPEQNAEMLRRYVRDNPRARTVPAGLAMFLALEASFPCGARSTS
jgi:hypothetical protein